MSDSDKMRDEFEAWAKVNSHFDISRVNNPSLIFHGQYKSVVTEIVWRMYQAAYAAGRKAEQETIRKLVSWQVLAPLIKLSERVNEEIQRNHPEGER